ncbi:hypothetical protein DPEC_G00315240 [Dallia pectoralis]|uniref:Uncharacterized protein n=1 Tax=Dallia pectoralis TaxID=75939 RepID=A0ACC2FCH7_DALPE|nr:hypothetical protein DPEC_G00315240 [Dallia pectoralis]
MDLQRGGLGWCGDGGGMGAMFTAMSHQGTGPVSFTVTACIILPYVPSLSELDERPTARRYIKTNRVSVSFADGYDVRRICSSTRITASRSLTMSERSNEHVCLCLNLDPPGLSVVTLFQCKWIRLVALSQGGRQKGVFTSQTEICTCHGLVITLKCHRTGSVGTDVGHLLIPLLVHPILTCDPGCL